LDESDITTFADSVFDRFSNPHIKHYLLSIALNSVSKFKARVLPSILDYHKQTGFFPDALTFSFAALLAFYRESVANDSHDVLEFFREQWQKNDIVQLVEATLRNVEFWGQDLMLLPGFAEKVTGYLRGISVHGVESEIKAILGVGHD